MHVKTVAISYPVGIDGINTAEEFIAYAARVSNPAGQVNNLTANELIRYLITNKHWSPLEMVSVTMEIETTRDIGRQILRHRSFSFQEFSQRYASVERIDENYPVLKQARLQDKKNRQNSIETRDEFVLSNWERMQVNLADHAMETYKQALAIGIAKEQARAILPEGLTPTKMYMAGTLRSWMHYCDLRCGNGTQLEHMEVANAVFDELNKNFPNVVKACT